MIICVKLVLSIKPKYTISSLKPYTCTFDSTCVLLLVFRRQFAILMFLGYRKFEK